MSKKENSNPRTSPQLGWECHWTSMSTDQEYSEEDFQQVLDLLRGDPKYSSIPMQMDSSGEFVISSNYEMISKNDDDDEREMAVEVGTGETWSLPSDFGSSNSHDIGFHFQQEVEPAALAQQQNLSRPRIRSRRTQNERIVVAESGKLGLTLANAPYSSGTVVVKVSPASVLVNQVSPGDWIITVDGMDVSQMDVNDVTSIISSKIESERVLTLLYSPQMLQLFKSPSPTDAFLRPVQGVTESVGVASKRRKVSKHDEKFEKKVQELITFKRENHHCNVPTNYKANPQLGTWVDNTRRAKRNGTLSKGREERLNKLGFDWGTSQDEQFEEHFQKLVKFKRENHHCLVPQKYEADPPLGIWVNYIRKAKCNGKLKKDREERLNKIGFVWDAHDEHFEEMFQKLVKFERENHHCLVPQEYKANPQLGKWVSTIRYAKRNGKLSKDREERLNEIGFVWDARAYFWDKNFHKLCRYKEEKGDMNVKFSEEPELYRWMTNQRELERLRNEEDERMLTQERFDKLNEIGFRWYDKKREPNRKVHRVEWKLMHEILELLEQRGETFFLLDRVYGTKTKYRPDGVVHCINLGSTSIIIEVDEKAHDSYSPAKEQARMKALKDAAVEQGFNNAVFLRINTGNWTEVSEAQVDTVNDVLAGIFADKPEGYHVYYVDYDDDHVHVQESEKKESSGIHLVKKFHTEGFDPKATRNKS